MIAGKLCYDIEIEVEDNKELEALQERIQQFCLKQCQGVNDIELVDSDLNEEEDEE